MNHKLTIADIIIYPAKEPTNIIAKCTATFTVPVTVKDIYVKRGQRGLYVTYPKINIISDSLVESKKDISNIIIANYVLYHTGKGI